MTLYTSNYSNSYSFADYSYVQNIFFSIFVIAGLVMTAFVSCYDTYMN